ncbi:MAG: ABC transporter permease [Phycisphaerae bacterium]|jgi:predicted permease
MGSLLLDLRYAGRTLWRSPGFALVVIITLALGIGANTAMLSLVNAALFRPLPGPNADRLMFLQRWSARGMGRMAMSYPDFTDYRESRDVFADLTAFGMLPMCVGRGDGAAVRMGQVVEGNYFRMLGAKPHLGRLLNDADNETPGGHPVAVLSYRCWQTAWQADPQAVGQEMLIAGQPFTIVGVAPPGFNGAVRAWGPDLWVPLMMVAQVRPEMAGGLEARQSNWVQVLGCLQQGVSPEQAQARLDVIAPRIVAKRTSPGQYDRVALVPATGAVPLTPDQRSTVIGVSGLVLAVVGLILVIACANVANVLLARASTRRKEIGIRLALGASRWRIVRQLLVESVLLAFLGGAVGVLLATWALDGAMRFLPNLPLRIGSELDLRPDGRTLLFTACVSLLTGLLFGLLPSLQATSVNVAPTLKEGAGWGGGLRRSGNRLRSALVLSQVAVSCVLLVCAGLFVRSLMNAQSMDLGFEHENILSIMLELGGRNTEPAAKAELLAQLVDRTRGLPGVESASVEDCPALGPMMSTRSYWIPGVVGVSPDDAFFDLDGSTITPGHLANLGITLLRGREFTIQDTADAPGVAIVNQAFVDRFWPGQDAVGKHITTHGPGEPLLEIVGVTETIKYRMPSESPRPYVYLRFAQQPNATTCVLLVRAADDPLAHVADVRHVMAELDPEMAPTSVGRLTDLIGYVLLPARFAAGLFGLFGLLALGLASVGLYGVMAYAVACRTHEIGVRVALGAERRNIVALVLKRCAFLTAVGTLAGLAIAGVATQWLGSLLFGVSPIDPVTFIGVALLSTLVALLAGYVPVRRATRVDPMVALRCE